MLAAEWESTVRTGAYGRVETQHCACWGVGVDRADRSLRTSANSTLHYLFHLTVHNSKPSRTYSYLLYGTTKLHLWPNCWRWTGWFGPFIGVHCLIVQVGAIVLELLMWHMLNWPHAILFYFILIFYLFFPLCVRSVGHRSMDSSARSLSSWTRTRTRTIWCVVASSGTERAAVELLPSLFHGTSRLLRRWLLLTPARRWHACPPVGWPADRRASPQSALS